MHGVGERSDDPAAALRAAGVDAMVRDERMRAFERLQVPPAFPGAGWGARCFKSEWPRITKCHTSGRCRNRRIKATNRRNAKLLKPLGSAGHQRAVSWDYGQQSDKRYSQQMIRSHSIPIVLRG